MATREAAVRLTLKRGAFTTGLRAVANEVKDAGRTIGREFGSALKKGAKDGAKGAGESFKSTFSGLKDHLKSAATLGGAISFGAAIKGAVELDDKLGEIAFNMRKAGENVTGKDLLAELAPLADKTGQKVDDLATAFDAVFKATGDLAGARASLEPIATIATTSGESMESLANAAQMLQRKFHVTAEEMPEALTRFIEKTGVGGASLDELGMKFGKMAGEASEAGFTGAGGVSKLLGLMVQLDDRLGEGLEPAFKKFFQTFKEGSASLKALQKASGIKFKADTTAFEKVEHLLTGKGRKAVEMKLTGESRALFDELAKPFDEAFAAAKKGGKTAKEATEAGKEAFRKNLDAAGKSTLTFADVQKDFANEIQDPQEQIKRAMDKFMLAFTKPEMLEAIGKLAAQLPKLAEGMAKLIDFAVEHPALAGAAFVGGKAAMGAVPAFGGSITKSLGDSAMKGIMGTAGKQVGLDFAGTVGKHGVWKTVAGTLGAAVGIAAAAAVAYELGTQAIDATLGASLAERSKAQSSAIGAELMTGQGTVAEKQEQLAKAKAGLAKLKEGPGVAATVFGGMAKAASAVGLVEPGVKNAAEQNQQDIARQEKAVKDLEEAIRKQKGEELVRSQQGLAAALDRNTKALGGQGAPAPGGGSKGPPNLRGGAPGAQPRSG